MVEGDEVGAVVEGDDVVDGTFVVGVPLFDLAPVEKPPQAARLTAVMIVAAPTSKDRCLVRRTSGKALTQIPFILDPF